jgi:hypothetical protein
MLDNHIVIKADKGNMFVTMQERDYIQKIEEFVEANSFEITPIDTTKKQLKLVRDILSYTKIQNGNTSILIPTFQLFEV